VLTCRASIHRVVAVALLPFTDRSSQSKQSEVDPTEGEVILKRTIVAVTAAAFLGAGALAPVRAETPTGFVPLPLIPAVLVFGMKEDKNFKAVNPYAPKKVSKRMKHKK
jgi:hypothetical protein